VADGVDQPGATVTVGVAAGAVDPDLALLDALADELDAVEAALARIDAGGYGRCATCGEAIDDAVLAADPLALGCPSHR
jgi:RNA polymerase-binding transcription factor DksA